MKKKKLIIVGGGISGLLCAYIFSKRRDYDIKVIESHEVGGEFLVSGMRYVGETKPVIQMLKELDLAYTDYLVKGGIYLRNLIYDFPDDFKSFDKRQIDRVRIDYYRKSRLVCPDGAKAIKNAFDDPANYRAKKAIKFNLKDLVLELKRRTNIVQECVYKIDKKYVNCLGKVRIPYDFLVLTIPVWKIKKMVWWNLCDANVVKMNSAFVLTDIQKFIQYDYVYTPYTPSDCIYKVISAGCGYVVESSGQFKEGAFHSDLEFLFDGEWHIENMILGNKGYMISSLERSNFFPKNIAPLGRFATWNSNTTVDVTLNEARMLLRKWNG